MRRSLSIAAYMAGLRRGGPDGALATQPARPDGAIIWARCSNADQLGVVTTLQRKLAEDGDAIQIIATVPDDDILQSGLIVPEPKGKDNIRAFIAHWRPMLVIWVQGDLDLLLLDAIQAAHIPRILVNATGNGMDKVAGGWVPGAIRSLLSAFDTVLAVDSAAAKRLINAGAPQTRVTVTGPMEDCGPVLPYREDERRALAAAIGTRQVWLAAAATPLDSAALALAQQQASRRAHRLLLVIVPDTPDNARTIATTMREAGFHVGLRSDLCEPTEPVQVFVVDTDDDLGLWYRISPITFLGGTLHGGGCRDPFEPAALGSAVLHGPFVAPFDRNAARLNEAMAAIIVRSPDLLGPAVESLLAPDKTATIAHAAWDVTSRGADVTNRIVTLIRQHLEENAA